jgi:aspartate/methionine/tyrosine aminotransferase
VASSTEACRQVLERARVGLAPGHLFGKPAERFLRMCVCKDPKTLETALGRMAEALG